MKVYWGLDCWQNRQIIEPCRSLRLCGEYGHNFWAQLFRLLLARNWLNISIFGMQAFTLWTREHKIRRPEPSGKGHFELRVPDYPFRERLRPVVKLLGKRWWIPIGARPEWSRLEPEGPRAEVGFPTTDQGFSSILVTCSAYFKV